tara:strand:+ start:729 stop:1211 length:483 start_codon:yes stop_codon:yes gene_type:complete
MSKWVIFTKGTSEHNLYRVASTDEIKNHYFDLNSYTPVILTEGQYLDVIKKNKEVVYNHDTSTMSFIDINYEQNIIDAGFEVGYLDATGAQAEKEGLVNDLDRYLQRRNSSEPGYSWFSSKKTELTNFDVSAIDYTQNHKSFASALEGTGQEIFDLILIP